MKKNALRILALTLVMVMSLTAAAFADAKTDDLTIICATNPGGAMDTATRLLSPYIEGVTGNNATVENIAGSAGWVALAKLATIRNGDPTVCYIAFPQIIVAAMDPSNDIGITIDDYVPIALDVDDNNIIVTRADNDKYSNAEEFIAYAKENDVLIATSAGVYSDDNVAKTYMLQAIPDLKFSTVHFTSTSEGMAAVLGGNVDILICNVSEAVANINAGELKGIAVMAEERSAFVPEVQTLTELGYNVVCGSTRGYVANSSISEEERQALCEVFAAAMGNEGYVSDASAKNFNLKTLIGDDFNTWLQDQKADMEAMYDTLQ